MAKGFAVIKNVGNVFKDKGRMKVKLYASVSKPGVGQDVVKRTDSHSGRD